MLEALAEEGDPTFVVALLADVVSRGFDGEGFRESACRAIGRLTVDRDVQPDHGLVDLVEVVPLPTHKHFVLPGVGNLPRGCRSGA